MAEKPQTKLGEGGALGDSGGLKSGGLDKPKTAKKTKVNAKTKYYGGGGGGGGAPAKPAGPLRSRWGKPAKLRAVGRFFSDPITLKSPMRPGAPFRFIPPGLENLM